jgi:ubiquinone biosynthesis protein UbiJ
MGRHSLAWSAIILGIAGVVLSLLLLVGVVLARGAVDDWGQGYLEPADRALKRLEARLKSSRDRAAETEQAIGALARAGAEILRQELKGKILNLERTMISLQTSVDAVNSGMEIISALPLFEDCERGFGPSLAERLAEVQLGLHQVEVRLEGAAELVEEIKAGGEREEKARRALSALARELTPRVTAARSLVLELGVRLTTVHERLKDAHRRIHRGLTIAAVILGFIFGWLAVAHVCVYLAGRRLLEQQNRATRSPASAAR